MQYTAAQIATIIGARTKCRKPSLPTAEINALLTDSRSAGVAEGTLFFALRSAHGDGHKYIPWLLAHGVHHFVVDEKGYETIVEESGEEGCFLVVEDTLEALQKLASHHRRQFDIPVVAITGSNGKTVCKEWLYQLLLPLGIHVTRSPRSYNSQIGVPLSLWLINKETDVAIIEAGISKKGEMLRLSDMIRPTHAVVTNILAAHQENFRSVEEKTEEKRRIFRYADTSIFSRDLKDFNIVKVEKDDASSTVWFSYKEKEYSYTIPFIDMASVENSITCMQTCIALLPALSKNNPDIGIESFTRLMPSLEPVAMRLEVKEGKNGCTIINDSYNSDINSLDIALDFLVRRSAGNTSAGRTLILSDILGGSVFADTQQLYSKVSDMLRSRGIQRLIAVGAEISAFYLQTSNFKLQTSNFKLHCFPTTEALLSSSLLSELHDEYILVKGSRRFNFERIVDQITQRVHQTILHVDLNALADNLKHFKRMLKPSTRITCMVKADAYGVGAVQASRTLEAQGVDFLAVALADEGVELRRAGIKARIMVMNPEDSSFSQLFRYHLEPEVYSFHLLNSLIHAARREGILAHPVHIKLDTGMHRLGFNPVEDMPQLLSVLASQQALLPASVFSHFVGSDEDRFDDFSHQQFRLFDEASKTLQEAYPNHRILRHICNSAGIEHFPQYQLDMVRLGIGLYGIDPRTAKTLSNVAQLTTTILQIRDVPQGDSIGYSRRTTVTRPSRVAAIPIGYADGLSRRFGNQTFHTLVHGHPAPYLGNICMDVCMIDVTDIPEAKEGDIVTIFGNQLSIPQLSEAIGTIPYEILTNINPRVQRIYNYDI